MRKSILLIFLLLSFLVKSEVVKIKNPSTYNYREHFLRLPIEIKDSQLCKVREDERIVPSQIEISRDGKTYYLWIYDDFSGLCKKNYTIEKGIYRGEKLINIKEDNRFLIIENNFTGIRIPLKISDAEKSPFYGIKINDKWIGKTEWIKKQKILDYRVIKLSEGDILAKVLCSYRFEKDGYKDIEITLLGNKKYIIFQEEHNLDRGSLWVLNLSENWEAKEGYAYGWFTTESLIKGASPHPSTSETNNPKLISPWLDESLRKIDLKPSLRLGNTFIFLEPRWTQNCEKGWFFGFSDGEIFLGILPVKASKWIYPYDNSIQAGIENEKFPVFRFPSERGSRFYYLITGKNEELSNLKNFVLWEIQHSLNEIVNKYPEGFEEEKTHYNPIFFYTDNTSNPTGGGIRGTGKNLLKNIKEGKIPEENNNNLFKFLQYIDPDFWGYPYNGWSPINPNFYTDFVMIPVALLTGIKSHPDYNKFLSYIRKNLDIHIKNSVVMPKGAGTECPGYLYYALTKFLEMNEACLKLGFDLREDERLRNAVLFLLKTSQPDGNGRRILPMGDTHPPGADWNKLLELSKNFNINPGDISKWKTEEFPGFGIIFRNNTGTEKETFFAFKSGPTRGHYHGDQLAFHYCAKSKKIAIDHMCSYSPRADQEHMHNRVFFAPSGWKYANIDGYERLIGFKTSEFVDIGIGQVESKRLRWMPQTPQEIVWQGKYEEREYEKPVIYRRHVIFIKRDKDIKEDYFLIWDKFLLPDKSINTSYALHVIGDGFKRKDNIFFLGNKLTLFILYPERFDYERFDWSYEKKDGFSEKTTGVFIRSENKDLEGDIITVLYPSIEEIPDIKYEKGNIRIKFKDGSIDEINILLYSIEKPEDKNIIVIRRNGKEIFNYLGKEIDLNRFQGEIGSLVLEAGYNFGEIPDWLKKHIENFPVAKNFL